MHEFHAWIGLSSDPFENDASATSAVIERIRDVIATKSWHDASFTIEDYNGQPFLRGVGFVNRRREEGTMLDSLIQMVASELPGSWGLIYESDDSMPSPPGPNAFRVRVVTRGSIVEHSDPFLSPRNPRIED